MSGARRGYLLRNSILLHSGLNPAWHFWLSTRFSCCLKMKLVENILGYFRGQFYRFSTVRLPEKKQQNARNQINHVQKTVLPICCISQTISLNPFCRSTNSMSNTNVTNGATCRWQIELYFDTKSCQLYQQTKFVTFASFEVRPCLYQQF